MRKIVNKIEDLLDYFLREKESEVTILLNDKTLDNGRGNLRVYVTGTGNLKYKFTYRNGKVYKFKYVKRLITDRMPMDELYTGIHDEMLSEFVGTRVQYFK